MQRRAGVQAAGKGDPNLLTDGQAFKNYGHNLPDLKIATAREEDCHHSINNRESRLRAEGLGTLASLGVALT
jgi:hypothetical protein